jgi:hypothetical protein
MLSVPAARAAFVEVGAARGLLAQQQAEGHGSGAAAADYDNDGDVDLFIAQAEFFPNQLYRNRGDGGFDEVAAEVGLDSLASARSALWFDYNADGRLDLIVANDDQAAASFLTLYRQLANGQFEDVTAAANLQIPPTIKVPTHHWGGICAGDINNDGYLDLYTGQWVGPGHLFLNNTDGTFSDISGTSGVAVSTWVHQPLMADFNNDGWMDIFVAVDFEQNLLWINQQDNTFLNEAGLAGVNNAMNDMGVALGDYDNDGDFDIYVTNIYQPPDDPQGYKHNVLFRNESVGNVITFAEVSESMGVEQGYFGWGTTWLDVDNDGDLDLAATNGWRDGEFTEDPSRLFTNPGDGSAFVDSSTEYQFDDTEWGSALLAVDFDHDGDLDLLQLCMDGPIRLLDNQPSGPEADNNYLAVRLNGSGPNKFGIGAKVRIVVDGQQMVRQISAGTSYMGQEPAEAFFGLGAATVVDSVLIEWPDGTSTILSDVSANQIATVNQSSGTTEPVPAASSWGLVVMLLLVLVVATMVFVGGRVGRRVMS